MKEDVAICKARGEGMDLSLADMIATIAKDAPKSYANWIINRYADGGIQRFEDISSRAGPLLIKYDVLKRKNKLAPKHRDINRIKKLADLHDIVQAHAGERLTSRREERKGEEDAFYKSGQAVLFHDDDDIKVVIPKTEAASCYFGRNTQWCTAATESMNYFKEYATRSDLYIVLIKKENKRFQFHFRDDQYMDERDEPINPRDLAKRFPVLWNVFRLPSLSEESIAFISDLTEEQKHAAILRRSDSIRFMPDASEQLKLLAVGKNAYTIKYIQNPSEILQIEAVKKSFTAVQYIQNPSETVQLAAIRNSYLSLLNIKNPTETVQLEAVKNNIASFPYINEPTVSVQLAAVRIHPRNIVSIAKPCEEAQLEAVKINVASVIWIAEPCRAVMEREDVRAFLLKRKLIG